MMHERDIKSMAKIYELLKDSTMQRVFFKEFQSYIQSEGEQILARITAEDEKAMKSTSRPMQSRPSRQCWETSSASTK
jgi:hypothetical protein